jgi:uncharacterized protein (DUF1800 family)
VLNSKGQPIPTYDQDAIVGFAHAFTGWNYFQANQANGKLPTNFGPAANWIDPMKEVPGRHFTGRKRILNNVVLPGLPSVLGATLDPYATHTTAQIDDPSYQALPALELDATHDAIFNHPNVGPFICRQLIQRFVTSTPSRGYIYRVVQAFNDNGSGVRGDMKAVIKAILLDWEARSPETLNQQGYGKLKEPVIRITQLARNFKGPANISGTYSQTGNLITVTTGAPHLLANGNTLWLNFTDGTPSAGTNASYSLASVVDATTFTVRPPESTTRTYSQTGDVITISHTSHGLTNGQIVYCDFVRSPTGVALPAAGFKTVTFVDLNTFTVPGSDSITRASQSNGVVYTRAFWSGAFTKKGNKVTFTTTSSHNMQVGDIVRVDFNFVNSGTIPLDGDFTVTAVPARDQFEFMYTADATDRTGNGVIGPVNPNFDRSGNVTAEFSTWRMDHTNTSLNQTPLFATTVFNFFEPDYQFPGSLSTNGLVTPEFQITSDTSVINQANFIFDGIRNPSNDTLSSFRSGNGNIFLNLGTWLGNNPSNNLPWTDNVNVPTLVGNLAELMTAGQMSQTAKDKIAAYAITTTGTGSATAYSTPATATQKRDRLRAIVHLIAISPDYNLQK